MDHLAEIYEHAAQPNNALHGITPAVVPRARLQLRRASGNFLFKDHRFGAKIDDFCLRAPSG